jgi:hypothetical protein
MMRVVLSHVVFLSGPGGPARQAGADPHLPASSGSGGCERIDLALVEIGHQHDGLGIEAQMSRVEGRRPGVTVSEAGSPETGRVNVAKNVLFPTQADQVLQTEITSSEYDRF